MDPCQSSQSSFSISIPKQKKKKKKHRDFPGNMRQDSNKIAAKVCSKKQVGADMGRSKYLSSEITPDEGKQGSTRRKLTRKNSVLDTPLKKQVCLAVHKQLTIPNFWSLLSSSLGCFGGQSIKVRVTEIKLNFGAELLVILEPLIINHVLKTIYSPG